jgi:hypothetical protein
LTASAVRDPELPDAARPQWRPWYAPAALFASFAAILVVVPPPAIVIGLLVTA